MVKSISSSLNENSHNSSQISKSSKDINKDLKSSALIDSVLKPGVVWRDDDHEK